MKQKDVSTLQMLVEFYNHILELTFMAIYLPYINLFEFCYVHDFRNAITMQKLATNYTKKS